MLLLLTPLATVVMGQEVDNGGGKIYVNTNEGDPGGPWGPAMEAVQMCLQHGTCDTINVEGFTVNAATLHDPNGSPFQGVTFRFIGTQAGVQQIEICIDETAPTGPGRLYLIQTPLTLPGNNNNGNQGTPPTEYLSIRVCVSIACPNCVNLVEEEKNLNR